MVRIGLLLMTLAFASTSLAAQRTFVASTGVDANPCSISVPCRSFGAAITHTDSNGEIIVLDSAGYGAVTIAKSVSIIAPPGVYAGISVFTNGIGVTINSPTGRVILRGLSINGQGGLIGILVQAATAVSIESCVVSEMKLDGVRIDGGTDVRIVGSIVRSNVGSGISMAAATSLVVEDTQFEENSQWGLYFGEGVSSIVRGSRFIANGSDGIRFLRGSGSGATTLSVSDSELSGNGGHGLHATALGTSSVGVTADRVSASRNAMDGVLLDSPGGGTLNSAFGGSQIAWNGNIGIATCGPGVNNVVVSASAVNLNGSMGISAKGGAVIQISGNSIARNGDFDLEQSGTAVINTFGNNALTGGGSDVSGTLTGVPLK